MSAFDELVAAAERDQPSQSLPRVLRAAVAASNEELAQWVRLELVGYLSSNPAMAPDIVVPEYRTVPGQWRDDFNRPLVINDEKLDFINALRPRGTPQKRPFVDGSKPAISEAG